MAAARRIYTPATNPRTHEQIFPPMERGSELVWARLAGGPQPIQLADDHFKYIVFENPAWDFRTLNFDTDLTRAMAKDNGVLSATGPDLAPFSNRGGKLIHFHGWTDQQVMPENSIHYFERVRAKLGSAADSSYAWDPPVNWDICAVAGRNPNARRDSNAGLNKRKILIESQPRRVNRKKDTVSPSRFTRVRLFCGEDFCLIRNEDCLGQRASFRAPVVSLSSTQ